MATYNLTTGDDTPANTSGADLYDGYLNGQTGGTDTLNGAGGNDIFALSAGDGEGDTSGTYIDGTVDGGTETDTVEIHGWYRWGAGQRADLGSMSFSNVEALKMLGGQYVYLGATIAQLLSFGTIVNTNGAESYTVKLVLTGAGGTIDFSTRTAGRAVDISPGGFELTAGYAVTGTAFGDRLDGSDFNDVLNGGDGHDFISVSGGVDALDAGAGDDEIYVYTDPDGIIGPVGIAGTIDGGANIDTVYSNGGVDFFGKEYGGDLGAVTYSNVEVLRADFGIVTGTIAQYNAFATIGSDYDVGDQIEIRLRGAGGTLDLSSRVFDGASVHVLEAAAGVTGGYTVTGTAYGDALDGSGFADTLNGGGGDDALKGGAGLDALSGGQGNDTYYLEDLASATSEPYDTVTEGPNGGIDTVVVAALHNPAFISDFYSLGAEVENLTVTGTLEFELDGNGLDNVMTGNDGPNMIFGLGGNDTLDGGAGADDLIGGAGNDLYVYRAGDSIIEDPGDGTDTVQSATSYNLASAPNVENVTLTGGGAVNAIGGTGNNRLVGNNGNNTLNGGGGNDTLAGLGGIDTLNGGGGNDTYLNPESIDVIGEAAGAAGGLHDKVQTLSSFNISTVANVEDIALVGAANVNAIGNNLANILTGNPGRNVINGGGGADTITGGGGNDTMNGGAGADLFKFATSGTGADTIAGFEKTLDRFDLAGGTFASRVEAGGSTTLTHAGGTILVTGVTGLSLAGWNALVGGGGRAAPDSFPPPSFTGGETEEPTVQWTVGPSNAAQPTEGAYHHLHLAHADFLYA